MTLPMGCADCGVVRTQHVADDHRWQAPSMDLIIARATAITSGPTRTTPRSNCRPALISPRPSETESRETYLYRIHRCEHTWPPELTPSAICGGCGLAYGEFSEEKVA